MKSREATRRLSEINHRLAGQASARYLKSGNLTRIGCSLLVEYLPFNPIAMASNLLAMAPNQPNSHVLQPSLAMEVRLHCLERSQHLEKK